MNIPTNQADPVRALRRTIHVLLELAEENPEMRDRFRSEAVGVAHAIRRIRETA